MVKDLVLIIQTRQEHVGVERVSQFN
jgi:hypothetical protein